MADDEQTIIAGWTRVGVLWNAAPASRPPDIEELIIQSVDAGQRNPRILVLMANWLAEFWRCVGRDRLCRLSLAGDDRAQAALGIVLQTADSWLHSSVYAAVSRRLARMRTPEPLLAQDGDPPALRRLAAREATQLSRRWGLWALAIERKTNAIRPEEWVWRANPFLRLRSLFKGSLKTSILACMEAAEGEDLSPTELARQCGVTRKAVYEALEDLRFSGIISSPPGARGRYAGAAAQGEKAISLPASSFPSRFRL